MIVQVELPQPLTLVFYFDYDKALLKPESRAALLEHAAAVKQQSAQCSS